MTGDYGGMVAGAVAAGAAVGHSVCPRRGRERAATHLEGFRGTSVDTGGPKRKCRKGEGGAGTHRSCLGAPKLPGAAAQLHLCGEAGGRTWSTRAGAQIVGTRFDVRAKGPRAVSAVRAPVGEGVEVRDCGLVGRVVDVVVGPKTGPLVAHWDGGEGDSTGAGVDGGWELVLLVRDHGVRSKQRCRRDLWSDPWE